MGKALSLTREAISSWETGIRLPSLEIAIRIAEYFGVNLNYLFGIEKQEKTVIIGQLLDVLEWNEFPASAKQKGTETEIIAFLKIVSKMGKNQLADFLKVFNVIPIL